ncbi:protein Ead [Salmonella enterica]|nr:protein Ead [Salmonella enterica]ECX6009234.1 ead/Ea22-like family protein [Salmonella enterica subsp. enterica serovar Rubislaw]EEJ9523780.1 ead/Ea22-like family protein [Salmonella enterica subsp. enterica serovar Rubislaw]
MTIDKQALRERYSPKPVPKCHICGEEMTIQRMSASRITYGCTGEGDDGYFKFGRTFVDEHYEESCVTVVDVSDPDVLALLDENLQLQREKDAIEAVALAMRDDMRQAREQLEAAEKRNAEQREYYEGVIADGSKRIAELESKNSNLQTIAHEQNELAIKANLDSINDAVEMDRLHKRIAELERSETQLISERDDAESALNDAYKAVMGQAPEWSNWFSFANAIDEIELACELWRNQTDDVIQFRQRIQELEAREVTLPAEKFCPSEYAGSQYWEETEVWNKAISACAVAIRAAGIKVKG